MLQAKLAFCKRRLINEVQPGKIGFQLLEVGDDHILLGYRKVAVAAIFFFKCIELFR